jgi:hypothetical protein
MNALPVPTTDAPKERPTAFFVLFFRQRFRSLSGVLPVGERLRIPVADTPPSLHFEKLGDVARDLFQTAFPGLAFFPKQEESATTGDPEQTEAPTE